MTTSAHGWSLGQRVRNESEPSLGLGMIIGFPNPRAVEVVFPGAGETRMYNPKSAPLRRYELGVGQTAQTQDGRSFRVERVSGDPAGLLTYHGEGLTVPEAQLADASASNDPLQRLIAGELGGHEAFNLRERGWKLRAEVLRQRSRGLTGARVSLLPHQLAIAYKIASRERPRVLLADEVGLGKTIEAGLIFGALRALGRADRVLVLTPSSLVHQWLVELYRRFHELFSVAHAEVPPAGVAAEDEPEVRDHRLDDPFATASRVIAPIAWLLEPGRLEQALAREWDLVIVDEAHHLAWSTTGASPAYAAVEALAAKSQGLLLLTATPLRQGLATEFGLLKLVDPERFADYQTFADEHAHLREVAGLARRLDAGEDVGAELRKLYPEAAWDGPPADSLRQLVDRHGTGRVLVRNRREKLGGFPGRQLHLDLLPRPTSWDKARAWPEVAGLARLLDQPPPPGDGPSGRDDPRVPWVLTQLKALDGRKAVVMAAGVDAVKAIARHLKTEGGLDIAMFHEGLGLVERDRQAAWFADADGAQVLVTSEIGGEGRNFQFCHHLILADLPLHPDALEQRIGRLDRIGQTETIQVHVAVVEGTPGEALFHWHRTMRVFEAPLTGGEHLMDAQAKRLLAVLRGHVPGKADPAQLAAFLAETETVMAAHQAEVQASVDFLIDLNSFDQPLGAALAEEIAGFDQQLLQSTVSDLLEHFGVVEQDFADPRLLRIRPGNHMKVEPFPGLRRGGYLATYDRKLALAREEVAFLSPDHELVEGALALLLDMTDGRASIARWPNAPEQGLRIEFLFTLTAVGPGRLELPRFLPPASLTVTLDAAGKSRLSAQDAEAKLQALPEAIWARLAGHLQDKLPELLASAEATANTQLAPRVQAALAQAQAVVGGEQARLEALQALGNVAEAEVAQHRAKLEQTVMRLGEARVSLDAVRVLLLDPGT